MKDFSFWNDFFICWFQEIGFPIETARQLAQKHGAEPRSNIESLARNLGYEIEYVTTLPLSVSGFAQTVGDIHYLIINRDHTPEHMQFTIAHELAHHLLRHSPEKTGRNLATLEFQADLFSSFWLLYILSPSEFERYAQDNPEAIKAPILLGILTAGTLLVGGIAKLASVLAGKTEEPRWKANPPPADSTPASQAVIS